MKIPRKLSETAKIWVRHEEAAYHHQGLSSRGQIFEEMTPVPAEQQLYFNSCLATQVAEFDDNPIGDEYGTYGRTKETFAEYGVRR